ncbi:MAG: hypothetical protein Kow00122_20960 [Thermoleophilia bacterium]
MRIITAIELARNLRKVLDRLAIEGEEVIVERNHRQVARIIPGLGHQTALEAMTDLYKTLPDKAAAGWLEDGRAYPSDGLLSDEVRDPRDS